jgi:hypothetical protein
MSQIRGDSSPIPSPGPAGRRYRWFALGILLLAAAWRAAIALTIPCAARDSVMFCSHARGLGEKGLAYLREPGNQQHPLYPAVLLATQRGFRLLGAPDTPMTWQRSGQFVSWLAGITVVALAWVFTLRVVRRLGLPVDARLAGCFGLLLAALLPLNVWLSAEAMSDELHLVFYLVGALALLSLDKTSAAGVCGLAAGLAFLTRPEGMVLLPAGLAAILVVRGAPWRARMLRGLVMLAAFLVCALPYWLVVGTLSPKKNPLNWLRQSDVASVQTWERECVAKRECGKVGRWEGESADETECPRRVVHRSSGGGRESIGAFVTPRLKPWGTPITVRTPGSIGMTVSVALAGPISLAKLELHDFRWWGLLPYALYQLFRAGRVVVPLLAIVPLISVRRRLLRPPLMGLSVVAIGHFALTLLLLYRAHYLDPRHMLVVNMLLVPFAAVALAYLAANVGHPWATLLAANAGHAGPTLHLASADHAGLAQPRRARRIRCLGLAAVVLSVLVLVVSSLRLPLGGRYQPEAAAWLAARDPDLAAKTIMSGSTHRPLVFYANARWQYWYEAPEEYAGLTAQILQNRPDYFAIETGGDFERRGNDQAIAKLRADESILPHIADVYTYLNPDGQTLYFFKFAWPPK